MGENFLPLPKAPQLAKLLVTERLKRVRGSKVTRTSLHSNSSWLKESSLTLNGIGKVYTYDTLIPITDSDIEAAAIVH